MAARLDALDPAARETLEDCAVIGTTGSLETVAALAERRGAGRPDSELDLLVGKELLSVERGEFGFKNELIRDVAYETLTKAERARRHARAVGHLAWHAQETGRIDEFLDQLAHHYGAAEALVHELGEVEGLGPDLHKAALGFLTRAARQAEHRETWPVVIRLLDLRARKSATTAAATSSGCSGRRARRAAPLRRGSSRSRCGHAPRRCTGRSAD